MAEVDHTTAAAEWDAALRRLGVSWGSVVVVLGRGADVVADQLLLADSPPLRAASPDVAVLSVSDLAGWASESQSESVPLPDGSADLVIAVHAWNGSAGVPDVVHRAHRLLRNSGTLVLAELDVDRLVDSTPRHYPASSIWLAAPALGARIEAGCVSSVDLAMEAIRAGLADVTVDQFDRTRGVFTSAKSHRASVLGGLWHGTATAPTEELNAAADVVSAVSWEPELVDREPWVLVSGRNRG